jgi:tripartite-type tricarboxylate transporter receptor subunit TctC
MVDFYSTIRASPSAQLTRRTSMTRFSISLFTALCCAFPSLASAQDYPARTVRVVVGTPPGGSVDVAARVVSEKLAAAWNHPVVVENRVGASETIGAEIVSKATPDGYTLLMASLNVVTINPVVFSRLPYDATKGLTPIVLTTSNPMAIVASTKAPFSSVKELIQVAKTQPGAISLGTSGLATLNHIIGEWLAVEAGVKFFHIPYKGAPAAANAVLSGEVPLSVVTLIQALPLEKSGRLKVLAVSTARRTELAPDWPTVAEAGYPGFDAAVETALFAPPGTPRSIIAVISAEATRVLGQPDTRKRLAAMGVEARGSTPEELEAAIKAGRDRIQKIVDRAGIKVQ